MSRARGRVGGAALLAAAVAVSVASAPESTTYDMTGEDKEEGLALQGEEVLTRRIVGRFSGLAAEYMSAQTGPMLDVRIEVAIIAPPPCAVTGEPMLDVELTAPGTVPQAIHLQVATEGAGVAGTAVHAPPVLCDDEAGTCRALVGLALLGGLPEGCEVRGELTTSTSWDLETESMSAPAEDAFSLEIEAEG